MTYRLALFFGLLPLISVTLPAADNDLVEVTQLDPTIRTEIAYATTDNFCKEQLYPVARCFLRRAVAEAVVAAHKSLASRGLGLKLWDGYRPHSVQYRMWEKSPLPGYVGDPRLGSKHNRGAAVDLTLVDLQTGVEVAMPTPFDEFSPRAGATYTQLPPTALENRAILQEAMLKQGFMTIPTEWWHFDFHTWQDFPLADVPLEKLADEADRAATERKSELARSHWPRFRGPEGRGIAADADIPLQWSEKENLKWKLDLPGPGSSSPIVIGDKILVTCYSGYGTEETATAQPSDLVRHLLCVDRKTGAVLWRADEPSKRSEDAYVGYLPEHGYASSTPATDGERVFCFYGKNGVFAYDLNGKRLWSAPTGTLSSKALWGSGSSVMTHNGLVYVNAGDEARSLITYDASTGAERWRMEAPMLEQTYSTPTIQVLSPTRTDLVVAMRGEIRGLDPMSGTVRWFSKIPVDGNLSGSPVVLSNSRIALCGGFPRILGTVISGGGEGDRSADALVWESQTAKSYLPMPVEFDELLMDVNEDGIALCVKSNTGEILYRERLDLSKSTGKGYAFYASPILVGKHLLAVSRSAGTFVIEAGPEFKLFGVNRIEDDHTRFQATPAVAGDLLILRSEKALYAIGR